MRGLCTATRTGYIDAPSGFSGYQRGSIAVNSPERGNQALPPEINITVAHTARVWNYWVEGKDNYPVDRLVGDQIQAFMPGVVDDARACRAFLVRAVQYLAGAAGIRQFLDIGTGLPTANNTHQVAQRLAPECRIVYVDNDPLVLAHARALLTSTPQGATAYLDADLRDPDTILAGAARTLDLGQPVALMMLQILCHVLDNNEAQTIVRQLLDALPAGSYLVLSDLTTEIDPEVVEEAVRQWNANATPALRSRTCQDLEDLFPGLELLPPGVVSCSLWRPDPRDIGTNVAVNNFGGVGRKP